MKAFRLVCLLSITYFIASCASTPTVESGDSTTDKLLAKEYLVSVGDKVSFKDSTIEFLDIVNDSRCPKGVQCVAEGDATLSFIYSTPSSAESFNLNTSDSSIGDFNGMKIGLMSFDPLPSEGNILSPKEFKARLVVTEEGALDDVTIIDVRTDGEYNNSHYSGAVNIPVDEIGSRISQLNLANEQTFVVYCRSGNRAAKAKDELEAMGYTSVINGVNEDSLDKLLD
ncbi:rhodanese-like domain-containing protein [Kangiella koreensis]|uniref:Rhodanese domain protein n=1 Tax=Kangiella koreensis (strain DSM 16069 / JCM 12317 / KCTC 12182 / SW-125) TaxID=523791 RepID=C7RBA1_KANKD|nr:rhodanese-like domain-containing protein [Kangiella koreensis]ACV26543.1 Rhodanese domain protein [Kangiella koreensis DSM 16069]